MLTRLLHKAQRGPIMLNRFGELAPSARIIPNTPINMWAIRSKSTMTSSSSQEGESLTSAPRDLFELSVQLERQVDIRENIRLAKIEIVEKQSKGRQLALNVSRENQELNQHMEVMKGKEDESLHLSQTEYFEREQRYEMFVNKMQQLYKNEQRLAERRKKALAKMEFAAVNSMKPVKTILAEYSKLTSSGFDCTVLAESLKRLNQAIAATGNNPISINDYNLSEMDQSWRMDKVTEDIKFGLDPNPNTFFSPYNLAKVARQLGELGYKNTDVMPMWFDKIDQILSPSDTLDHQKAAEIGFGQNQFGGQKGIVPRHYIYQGFDGSQEFRQHVETLKEYEETKRLQRENKLKAAKGNVEFKEIMQSAFELIEAAEEVKDMQQEMQAAVRNVRGQYAKMLKAHDEHEFLQDNDFIQLELLELQEMLIKAGYISPEEKEVNDEISRGVLGMDAAVEVFYNVILNNHPTAVSPQYEDFYNATKEAVVKPLSADNGDTFSDMRLHTLSSTLVGVEKQAMSYRRDIVDHDFPTEFYEKLLSPEEEWLNNQVKVMAQEQQKMARKLLPQYVVMERTYLNGWTTFFDRTANVPETMEKLLQRSDLDVNDCLSSLRALNVCRFQAKELRQKIGQRYKQMSYGDTIYDAQALVDGIYGLAGCTNQVPNSGDMVKDIMKSLSRPDKSKKSQGHGKLPKIRRIDALSFLQCVELLKGLTTPGVVDIVCKETMPTYLKHVKSLCNRLDYMGFDMIANELKFDELKQIYDAYSNLKYSEVRELRTIWAESFTNKSLRGAMEQHQVAEMQYAESSAAAYDPLKPRVVGGLTESLIKADLKDLHIMQMNETGGMQEGMFPYAPDVLMGYEGQKVGIFVLNNDCVMRDTDEPCGFTQGKMRLVESAHKLADKIGTSAIKNIALPVRRVVDADLQQHKLEMRSDFNLQTFLSESGLSKHIKSKRIDTNQLSNFSVKLAREAQLHYSKTTASFEEFCIQLLHVLRKREQMDSLFEQEQVVAAIDELKLQMLKLVMMHDTNLSAIEKSLVKSCLSKDKQKNMFKRFIYDNLLKPISDTQKKIKADLGNNEVKKVHFWQGTRLEVEVPVNKSKLSPKSILPEILNQKFLWYESYHHYDDWESKMKESYDQFNLLELAQTGGKDTPSLYFHANDFKRRIPRGIFPDAKSPRVVLRPPGAELEQISERDVKSQLDSMTKFERSPMQTMVNNELERNSELTSLELGSQMQTICNLQSIKHSLKSDLSDHEICSMLFNNLSFTDKLIASHLSETRDSHKGNAVFVERNAENYRQFVNEQGSGDGLIAPYDHFYMKEALKKGNPEEITAKIFELQNEHPKRPEAEFDAIMDDLKKKLEDCLLNYKRSNEDAFNLSKALDNTVEVTIDISTLSAVQKRNHLGLGPVDLDMAPEHFLKKQRCRAEANLIKGRIAYKVHQDIELSQNEKKYLNAWMDKSSQTEALLPQADLLVPEEPSNLSLAEALSAEDFYALNSLSRVSIQDRQRKEISLSDLVLELVHFIDTDTIRKVELGFLEDNLRKEWELADDFSLVEKRNKEIDLVMRDMEEVSWRAADQFDAQEKQSLEDIAFFDRGLDAFNNAFLDMDRDSFSDFFDEANNFDSRVTLLENWMCRKDDEVKNRVTLPPPQMAKSDQVLFNQYDAPLKKARESLTGQMLTTDEFGNDRPQKAYSELTTRELHLLTESLCVRLNLFQKRYPAFLPQVIKAVQEHPSLANSDRFMIDAYCKLFELDWRGDSALENREQFMMSNPVYMNEKDRSNLVSNCGEAGITNEGVLQQIRQACQPYLPDLLQKMRKLGGKQK